MPEPEWIAVALLAAILAALLWRRGARSALERVETAAPWVALLVVAACLAYGAALLIARSV